MKLSVWRFSTNRGLKTMKLNRKKYCRAKEVFETVVKSGGGGGDVDRGGARWCHYS